MHPPRFALILCALALLPCRQVAGAFINGVETFPGTQLDLQTWSISEANAGASYFQDNSLTIAGAPSAPPYGWGGYTTTSPLVGVGGSVWAEVRVNSAAMSVAVSEAILHLDTDPSGVFSFQNNSVDLSLNADFSQAPGFSFVAPGERVTTNGSETGFGSTELAPTALPLGSVFIFQIRRLTSSGVQFSLFSKNGPNLGGGTKIGLVGDETLSSVTTTDPMYVFLEAQGTDTTFLSVTVNHPLALNETVINVPEPGGVCCLLFVGAGALRRRRAIQEKRSHAEAQRRRERLELQAFLCELCALA